MRPSINLINATFGRWTVVDKSARRGLRGELFWLCRCSCGSVRDVSGVVLRNKGSTSCGCSNTKRAFKHGGVGTPEYSIYHSMLQRCLSESCHAYPDYGGRGITVCQEWQGPNGFINFLRDVGTRPKKGLSLERKDNKLGYSKENCVWATAEEQCSNRRSNIHVTLAGETLTLAQWTRRLGLSKTLVSDRLRRGWSAKDTLTTPVNKTAPLRYRVLQTT